MLRKRILSAAGMLLVLFAAALLLPDPAIMLLIMALATLASIEFALLLQKTGIAVFTKILLPGAILLTGAAYLDQRGAAPFNRELAVLAVLFLLIMTGALRGKTERSTLTAAACTLLGLLYLPLMLNFILRLALMSGDRLPALFPIIIVKLSDIGAFFSGRRFGRRKLCPHLSPGKTWAGLGGGMATACLAAFLCALLVPAPAMLSVLWRPLPLALIGILLAALGVVGDLSESFLKRVAGVKDSGGVLPGMGGVMDVLDSLLFSLPAFYIIIRLAMVFA